MQHNINSHRSILFHALFVLLLGAFAGISGCRQQLGVRASAIFGMDTHTVDHLQSISQYLDMASQDSGQLQTVKFIITDFNSTKFSRVIYLDSQFYCFHDEWYWYLRLNGHPALGDRGISDAEGCATPSACVDRMKNVSEPPMDLRFVDDRLYSQRFYDLALADDREIGLGALLYRQGSETKPPVFGFRLEYVDVPTAADIQRYFRLLQQTLPPEIAEHLVWFPRSPAQTKLAAQMVLKKNLRSDQIRHFADLASEGEAEIYNSGVTVGRLLLVEQNVAAMASEDDHILVVDVPPDDLPQAAGLISAVPLTALSHLNILARNRGIPSAYVGGIFENPWIRQLSDGYAPVVLEAKNGEVKISPLSAEAYQRFRKRPKKTRINPVADYAAAPYVVDLNALRASQRSDWPALIGGKSAGFEVLQAAVPDAIPGEVAIVTTRAYWEHMDSMKDEVTALLSHQAFQNSARVRYFVLEGAKKYYETFATQGDLALVNDLKKTSPRHFALGQSGGLKHKIQTRPLAASALSEITHSLKRLFKALPKTQGLRFRSSSTVEDIDTFNGAGLYDSNTGFLYPSALAEESDRARTVERAIKKTWASYWNFHAFEERRNAGIEHQSGAMGVVVHARFDDALEIANGVITFSWNFAGDFLVDTPLEKMVVNTQQGALSVTNPKVDRDALPEAVLVSAKGTRPPSIERQRSSIVGGEHRQVLSDDEYMHLFELCHRVADVWQTWRNTGVEGPERSQTITLDLEFRKMADNWAGFTGDAGKSPLVLKQVRSLSPAPLIPDILEMKLPVPKDVLLRAGVVERVTCADFAHQLKFFRVSHAAASESEFGAAPFIADLTVTNGDRLEILSGRAYYQPDAAGVIVFSQDAAVRLGMRELRLGEMTCDSKLLAAADTSVMHHYAKQGRVIGREKVIPKNLTHGKK